jgi:exopolysaccharide production protein ExoQ
MLACSRPLSTWLTLNTEVDLNSISAKMSEGSPVDRAVGAGLLILGLMVLFNRQKVMGNLYRCWPIVLFLMYCLVSLAWSDFPDVALKRLIRVIGDWVMILVIWTDPKPITALTRLVARTTYTLIPLSILAARYYPFGRGYGYWTGEKVYIGVTDNKNTLGAICLLLGVASVWHLINLFSDSPEIVHRKRHVLVHVAILAMTVYLLVIANSMTSASCGLLVIGVLLAIRFRVFARRRFMVHFLVAVTISIPILIAFLGALPGALQAMGRDATLTDRTLIWSWVIKLVPNQWVGAGFSSFWLGDRLDVMITNVTHTWVPNQAHNGYLEVFANLGWVGVGLLGLVIFWGYCRIIRAWRQKRPGSDLMLAYFLIGVISNLSEASFFRALVPAWLFFVIAITMPPTEEMQQCSEQTINPRERSHRLTRVTGRDAVWTAG